MHKILCSEVTEEVRDGEKIEMRSDSFAHLLHGPLRRKQNVTEVSAQYSVNIV
jgi:hypothetical protein